MPEEQVDVLRELARRRAMSFVVVPERGGTPDGEVVALELRLSGRHSTGARPSPGCQACSVVRDDLRAVARLAFPDRVGRSCVELLPPEPALYSPADDLAHDYVQLRIRVSNGQRLGAGLGGGAEGIVAAARARLQALQIQQRRGEATGSSAAVP